jgi:hypothetical protein
MSAKLKTTEFWFSILAILVGALMGAGLFGDGTIYAKVGGWIIMALGSAGYTTARTLAKANDPASTGKPGYRTLEFWKALGVALLVWLQAHITAGPIADIVGQILMMLPVGTYIVARGVTKGAPPPTMKGALLETVQS